MSTGQHWPFYIESGRVHGLEKYPEWKLAEGSGPRVWTIRVNFSKAFSTPPEVFISFALLDLVNSNDYRVQVSAKNITTTYFDAEVSTWENSEVWSVAASWLAYDKVLAAKQDCIIQHGVEEFDRKKTENFMLHKGEGVRTTSRKITLATKCLTEPEIVTSMCMITASSKSDLRFHCLANNITVNDFVLNLNTWGDSSLRAGAVAWIAIDGGLIKKKNTGGRIQTGNHWFKQGHTGYTLNKGSGNRSLSYHIQFKQAFTALPRIVPLLSAVDVLDQNSKNSKDDSRDARINVEAQNTTATGFELKVNTWNNTLIWSVTSSYIAYGDAEFTTPPTLPSFQSIMTTPYPPPFASSVQNQYPMWPTTSTISNVPYSTNTTTTTTTPQNTTTTQTSQTSTAKPNQKSEVAKNITSKKKSNTVSGSDTEETPPKKKQKTSSNVSTQTTKGSKDDDECRICMDAKINTVIIPCGHLCVCLECSKLLMSNNNNKTCPICKQNIQQIIKTFQT